MRTILPALLLLTFSLTGHCLTNSANSDPQTDPLEGVYSVSGKEGDTEYTGIAIIRMRDDSFSVQSMTHWRTEEGEAFSSSVGVGLKEGAKLSVAWKANAAVGLTIYEVGKGAKELRGRWVILTAGGVRTETLTKLASLPK